MRNKVAETYTALLKGSVDVPALCNNRSSVWAQYTIRVPKRDELRDALKKEGIPTAVHYPMPLPRQEAFSDLEPRGEFPVSDRLAATVLSLPMHPFLKDEEIHFIADTIKEKLHG
jgi:UDP-2-acetamido-2-deoxy-ribo-hexuluronate aminotransferase